jgi:hypothetical protein
MTTADQQLAKAPETLGPNLLDEIFSTPLNTGMHFEKFIFDDIYYYGRDAGSGASVRRHCAISARAAQIGTELRDSKENNGTVERNIATLWPYSVQPSRTFWPT